jgi:RNA-directed DNA polymerase
VSEPKPFVISKRAVWAAWLRVKANGGAAGVDELSLQEFERDLKGNLDKLWNRLRRGPPAPWPARSVPLGKYWRSSPLVFSLVPRCHGLCGSQK